MHLPTLLLFPATLLSFRSEAEESAVALAFALLLPRCCLQQSDSTPKKCHPERSSSRTLRTAESKDLRLLLALSVLLPLGKPSPSGLAFFAIKKKGLNPWGMPSSIPAQSLVETQTHQQLTNLIFKNTPKIACQAPKPPNPTLTSNFEVAF